jgi:transcriptional regulator with XRE-family HTH domain
MVDSSQATQLANNLRRLLGLHGLRATRDSRMMGGLSPQLLSELQSGSRQPSLSTVTAISEFLEISRDRLLDATFEELLSTEVADAERFRNVEAKIAAWRTKDAPKKQRPSSG